jgi:hypothetical protein
MDAMLLPVMGREILSITRPTRLRLAGFLTLTLGGALLGLGALLSWATVGFTRDAQGALDLPTKGIDLWEGGLVLAAGVAVLVGMIAMRLLLERRARQVVAAAIIVLGVAATALAASDALRAETRFGGTGGLDAIAHNISSRLDRPYAQVRPELERQYGADLRVDLEPGIFMVMVGGLVAASGGLLSIAWANRARPAPPEDLSEGPDEGDRLELG